MKKIQDSETFCVGRHLIDLPDGFRLVMPSSATFRPKGLNRSASSIEVSLVSSAMTPTKFEAAVQKRQSEIVAFSDDTTDVLKEVQNKGNDAILLRILRIEQSYSSELHFVKDSLYLKAEAKSYDGRFPEAETNLAKIADQILGTKIKENDVGNGFCLGPVVAQGEFQEESASFEFMSDKQPGIVVKVDIDSYGLDEPKTLLQRINGPDSLLAKFDARNKVLRQGEIAVAGQRAEEWLSSVNLGANRDRKQFGFAAETVRRVPGPASPRVHIELDTGQHDQNGVQQPSSLTDEQAIAFWDSLISSMRLRQQIKH